MSGNFDEIIASNEGGTNISSKRKRTNSLDQRQGQYNMIEQVTENDISFCNGKDFPGKNIPGVSSIREESLWIKSIENVVKSVVSIRFSQVSAFDTEFPESGEASGFIIDAKNGYILTNRHVVSSGPFWGHVICENHEEIDVYPIYRDPIHDFGILKFDPKSIKYMPVVAIPLRPDLARVGTEIRVVGNDAAEKLSILSGWISRVDRNAPEYGDFTYSDFNTNYIQAAANASGGSSGSPVVNINGYAVALQAGGRTQAATDFFLPLDRPLRALRCLQNNLPITRGTIQVQWMIRPFDECRRLGLSPSVEACIRQSFPEEVGLLVAETVLPEGPGDGMIVEGDILIRVNGEILTKHIPLESILDESVGKEIQISVQRGGEDINIKIKVCDKHKITPDRYVEYAGAKFHNLSYQLARSYAVAVKGVFISEPEGSFRLEGPDQGYILDTVDTKPVPDLDTFIEVVRDIPDRKHVVVTYRVIHDMHSLCTQIVHIDRHWATKFRLAIRNDSTGLWDFHDLGSPPPPEKIEPKTAKFITLDNNFGHAASLVKSFVKISYFMPIRLDGFPKGRKSGTGLIVDKEKGLAVTSRSIVPFALGDLSLTFADSIIIPGKIEHLHPTQNIAFISYDPKLLADTPVQAAKLSNEHLSQGSSVYFVGVNHSNRIVGTKTVVTDVTTVTIPQNATPRFRAINVDSIFVDTNLGSQCGSGVLCGEDGSVKALWLTYLGERTSSGKDVDYHMGLAISTIMPILEKLRLGITPKLRMLNIEVYFIQMAQARNMGVSDELIRCVENANHEKHQLLLVRRVESGNGPKLLQDGDVILTVNQKIVTRMQDLDVQYTSEELKMVILRKRKELTLNIPTILAEASETDRVVMCFGALLQAPHRAVRQQSKTLHTQVYVSAKSKGSPAYQYGLVPTMFITHINGVFTPDLDAFLKAVLPIPDNTYVRIRTTTFDNIPIVLTLKLNLHYFPTIELIKDETCENGWRQIVYEPK